MLDAIYAQVQMLATSAHAIGNYDRERAFLDVLILMDQAMDLTVKLEAEA